MAALVEVLRIIAAQGGGTVDGHPISARGIHLLVQPLQNELVH